MMHSKPKINKIKIGNITTDGQPCADPNSIIRKNPAIALRMKQCSLEILPKTNAYINAYRP